MSLLHHVRVEQRAASGDACSGDANFRAHSLLLCVFFFFFFLLSHRKVHSFPPSLPRSVLLASSSLSPSPPCKFPCLLAIACDCLPRDSCLPAWLPALPALPALRALSDGPSTTDYLTLYLPAAALSACRAPRCPARPRPARPVPSRLAHLNNNRAPDATTSRRASPPHWRSPSAAPGRATRRGGWGTTEPASAGRELLHRPASIQFRQPHGRLCARDRPRGHVAPRDCTAPCVARSRRAALRCSGTGPARPAPARPRACCLGLCALVAIVLSATLRLASSEVNKQKNNCCLVGYSKPRLFLGNCTLSLAAYYSSTSLTHSLTHSL